MRWGSLEKGDAPSAWGIEQGFAEVMTIIELMEMTNGFVPLFSVPLSLWQSQRTLAKRGHRGQPYTQPAHFYLLLFELRIFN